MKRRGNAGKGKRASAWLLTFVMLASLVMVPAGKVEAAETITVTNATDSSKNVYVELEAKSTIPAGKWGAGSPAVDLTEYNVIIHNNTDGMISDWTITLELSDDSSWNAGWNGVSKSGNTITIGTYKGTDAETGEVWSNAEIESGKTAGGPGFQVASSAVKIDSVTIAYNKGTSSGDVSVDSTATDPAAIGTTSSNVTATITQSNIAGDYHEYYLQVNNGLSESISDWIVAIPLTGVSSSEQWGSWAKVKTSYTSSYLYLSPSSSSDNLISQGNSFGSATSGDYKFNYKGSNDIDTSKAVVYYKTGSSSSGAFDAVVSNSTQASGGSSGSGGTGGSGAVQGDTTTNLNLDVEYNFAKLLQYSLYFYDANMCGELEGKCAVDWRKNCHLADKTVTYNGKTVDVSGGFHDAGDHDKFGLPQGYTAAVLGMGYYEFKDAYVKTGQSSHFKTILDYFCDYFVRCTVLDSSGNAEAFCYQVGDGASHSQWVVAEEENINRPAYFADSTTPATDQVSEAAAALAIHYMNFGNDTYLDYAEKLFAMAEKNPKVKQTDAQNGAYYGSSSWADDYCLAAAWLYKATGDSSYLTEYNNYKNQVDTGAWPSWDQVGPYALAYGSGDFSPLAANATATINQTQTISNGYAWLCKWGSARYNSNMQLEGLIYDKNADKDQYTTWAKGQMKFLLGNSADKRCYVVGYNENSSRYPHHRSSSGYGGFPDSGYQTAVQAHVLTGALVGGIEGSDGAYHDSSADYYCNEVAIDYNAAFTGAAAALYLANEDDEDQMLDSNYAIDSTATCPANEGGIAANGSEEVTKTELTDSDITFPTASDITYGQSLADAALSKASDDYGTFAWKDETIKPTAGLQTYEVVYTPTNTKNYDYSKLTGYDETTKKVVRTVSITVSKKVLTEVTFPSVSKSVEAGTLLKNVALSKSSDDYGTFAWKNSDTAVTGAMTGAEVVYTLKDTTNVEIDSKVTGVNAAKNTVTRTVTFDVTKKKPVITVPESITVDAGTELKDVPTAGCEAGSVEGTFTWKETNKILTSQDNETGFTLVFTPADTDSYASVEQQVILIVNKKVNTKVPAAPELSGKTTDSVTLAAYTGTETVEYGIKSGSGSYTWQTDNIFTGLSPFTTYTFAQRFAADDIYEAGNAGTSIDVTTYLEETDCYVVDLSKLSDKYVEAHNGTISYDSGTKTLSLLKAEAYTIKGTDESVTISCGLADTVILNNATLKRLEAAEDVTIELIGNNVIVEGITGTGKVTIQNGSETAAAGVLTVSGSDDAAIKADIVVLESGQITAAGSGTAAAVKGTEIQLLGGSLVANADDDVIPIQADRIVLDGCQVQSDAAKIYSTEPVDREGNIVTLRTVTYKDGDAVLGSPSVKQNAEVTLPNLAKKDGYKAEGWIEDGTEEVLAQGTKVTITEDIIYQAKYTKITGSLSVEVNETSEAPLTVGYASDEGVLVTITNNTNVTIDELDISLDSDEDFTVSPVSIKALAVGAEEELRVCLKKGKGVNLEGYTVNLSISCDELSDAVNKVITRKVQKAQAAKPDKAPSIKDRTDTSVTLASVTGAEYGKRNADGTFDWQTSSVFTGLEPYTTYIFAIRYKATENTEASEASDTAAVVTLMSEQARYEVDVTQLGDDQYADAHGGTISVEDNTLVLEKEAVYTITGTNENLTIHAEENVTIILKDAEVAAVTGDKNVIILLEGESKIISGKDNTSAVEAVGKVTISKNEDAQTGSVIIQGGNGAAGITAKEVEIQEGTVSITGGSDAAGIAAGKVTITGEAVSVTGQGDKPAVDAEIKDIASSVIINNGSNYKDPNETPVVKKVESITVNISAASIIEDMTAVATAEVLPADAADKSVTWSSSNSLVAAVSQEGLVTAVSEGTADIIATANDGSGISGKVTVTVVDNGQDDEDGEIKAAKMTLTADVKGAEDVPVKNTYKLAPGKKLELNVTFLPENAEEEELTFASSNKKIAKVDEDGEITAGKKAGKATITVTSANGLKKTFKIQVMKKPIKKVKLKASKKVVKVKKKLKLKVTLTPNKKQASDSVYWKSNNPKIAAVTQAGVVKGIKKGKVKITAVATDGSGKKAAITIQVK